MRGWTDIDWTAPVNRFHPLNRGRVSWLLTIPGLTGSNTWIDLIDPANLPGGALQNMERTDWKGPSGRPGDQWGHLEFGGTDETVEITGLKLDANLGTYLGWVSFAAMSGNGFPWTLYDSSNDNLSIRWDNVDEELDFKHKGSNNITLISAGNGIITEDSSWHFLSQTWTVAGDELAAYINGVQVGTASSLVTYVGQEDTVLLGENGTGGAVFVGAQSEISFFNRVLSPDEIYEYYLLSQQGYPGLLNRLQPRSRLAQVIGNTPDTDAGIFTLGQQQPIIEPFVMIPY